MSDNELVCVLIDQFSDLKYIKQANGGQENVVLDYVLKVTATKLSYLGVNIEDITLT